MALGGDAWLNFMGNEFGHSEWIDFPRRVPPLASKCMSMLRPIARSSTVQLWTALLLCGVKALPA